ncbi:MAG TPA: tRNA (adenosine(37)-N6)-dimethylallyltransferase MiaA [Dehalococcoidales bacterium]|nr:tRNA (adenosine(37)-N6)-dimethylallyltransferase MiaA [Dehalococcoidales bacterium]
MNRLLGIVGPTGVGKSHMGIQLAQALGGEIVNADSRQVYRFMDIGTAKPTPQERAIVPHHLIDVVSPNENFSLAQYQQLAVKAIEDIQQRDKLPIVVGGSGQYVWSVMEGWGIPQVAPNPEFRQGLEERVERGESNKLHEELNAVDPEAAQRIDPRNVRRTIRALEVFNETETPFSQLQRKEAPPFNIFVIGLTADREELYRRIDLRVDRMIEQGLVDEAKRMLSRGFDFNMPALSSIGYRQIGQFLREELTLPGAIQQIKFETHRLARQQYTWFQLEDTRIHWFDIQRVSDHQIMGPLNKFLRGKQ